MKRQVDEPAFHALFASSVVRTEKLDVKPEDDMAAFTLELPAQGIVLAILYI
jgi:hypothetical protein